MTDSTIASQPPRISQIAAIFARYANFTLGGGSATIAVLHQEILDKRKWLNESDFALCFALCRLTPGTNLLAFCAGVGWVQGRSPGAIVALLAASIPSAIIVTVMTAAFSSWQESALARATIHGAIAAAVAITIKTCWVIAKPHFKGRARSPVILIAATAFLLYTWAAIPAIDILLLAAGIGAALPPIRA
jgi:chromate transporter